MRHIIGGSMLLGALADTSTADDKFQFLSESLGCCSYQVDGHSHELFNKKILDLKNRDCRVRT